MKKGSISKSNTYETYTILFSFSLSNSTLCFCTVRLALSRWNIFQYNKAKRSKGLNDESHREKQRDEEKENEKERHRETKWLRRREQAKQTFSSGLSRNEKQKRKKNLDLSAHRTDSFGRNRQRGGGGGGGNSSKA